jgi:hypothetical protein
MYNDDRIAHWSIFLNEVKTLSFPKKKIFISYAWDGDAIETDWLHMRLKRIRDDLITLGIEEVFLDISHMNGDITITMQEKLATPDLIVLVICTPLYVQRINDLVRNPNNVRYEYLAILKKLEYQPHSVYPLQLAGTFGSAVPEALRNPTIQGCQLLVRDFRDPLQHEAQMGQLDNGLGLIPGIVGLRLDTPLGKDYHAKWQYFAHAYWGDADHPSHLLRKLENKSRQLQKEENIVETKAYYIPNDVSRTRDGTRTSNLTQLWQHVGQQAATTNGRVFLLFGESGVGKSTALMHYESQ